MVSTFGAVNSTYPWHVSGVNPTQNTHPIGSASWKVFQKTYGMSEDIAEAAAQMVAWKAELNAKQVAKLKRYPLLETQGSWKRRLNQSKFKFTFDRYEDLSLRLMHSIICVGAELFYVRDIMWIDGKGFLILDDADGKSAHLPYDSDTIDLRTPDPQYYMDGDTPMYYFRIPSRQQSQGLTNRSAIVKKVGESQAQAYDHHYRFMKGMKETQPVLWSPAYADIIVKLRALRAIRLSQSIAFFREDDRLLAEYRGRRLGTVYDDEIHVDDDDFQRPWIKREAQRIGCALKHSGG